MSAAMSAEGGPSIPRRRLGFELRRLREAARLRIEDVAADLECSVSKVSRLETGKGIPKVRDVRDLLQRYGVDDPQYHERVMRWAREGQSQGWWTQYSDVLVQDPHDPLMAAHLERYVALEADAELIETFEPIVVYGLLQTEDYARAILQVLSTNTSPALLDRVIEVRLRRQQRLYAAADRLSLHLVIDESVLHRRVGGDRVMQQQLRRLLEDGERDNIDIRVMPFHNGAHPAVAGSFVLLDFPETPVHDVVYIESHLGNVYLEKDADVDAYTKLFRSLSGSALTPADSAALIESLLT
ncbi:MAG: helix-turn-helix domain-containing protein [Pseudonocardiaceae bacterium]|nr:helix-turn-helix domain-containing protein [Pseudonocardiaceae bacterium]